MNSAAIAALIRESEQEKALKQSEKNKKEQDLEKLKEELLKLYNLRDVLTPIPPINTNINSNLKQISFYLPYAYKNEGKIIDYGKTDNLSLKCQNNNASLESGIALVLTEISKLEEEIKFLEKEIENLTSQISDLTTQIASLQAQYQAALAAEAETAAAAATSASSATSKSYGGYWRNQ